LNLSILQNVVKATGRGGGLGAARNSPGLSIVPSGTL
jgi:hypothetical protein